MKFEDDQLDFINYVTSKKNDRKGEIVLNASAGTGKTTVAKYLNNLNDKIIFLAPTHKAAAVLRKGKNAIEVETIHKFLNAKANYTELGDLYFEFRPSFKRGYIIFIDECSMVNNKMMEAFHDLSNHNLIIYMGDDLQLPPIVKEELDDDEKPIKKESIISKTFSIKPRFEFKKNQRSKKFTSTVMLQLARDSCYSKRMPPKIAETNLSDILDCFKDLQQSDETVIILSYTNASVNNYNKKIRSHLFNVDEDKLEPYYINEKLVFGSSIRRTETKKYFSSEMITIVNLSIKTLTMSFDDFQCKCKDEDYNKVKCKEHGFRKGKIDLEFYEIIDEFDNIWYKPLNQTKFSMFSWQYKRYCIINKNNTRLWPSYYAYMVQYNADLKYEYAQTIHKSQGSQYNIVFVDRSNLVGCTTRDNTLRLNGYYTAISRMIDEVYDIEHKY